MSLLSVMTLMASVIVSAQPKFDRDIIFQTFQKHDREVALCYERALEANPDLEGKVVVDFQVDEKGRVSSVKIGEPQSSLKDKKIHDCLLSQVKTFTFPPAEPGEPYKVLYPFVFSRGS